MSKKESEALDRNTAVRAIGIIIFFYKDELQTIISALVNMFF